MLSKFKTGDKVISLKSDLSLGLTKNASYKVLSTVSEEDGNYVKITADTNIWHHFNENRFILDTPKNRRKLQIFKMFEPYGKEEE